LEPRELAIGQVGVSLAISPDGRRLAESGSPLEAVRVWDMDNGHLLHRLPPPETEAHRTRIVVFSPDGKNLIASTMSNTAAAIHIWDAQTGKHLTRLEQGAAFLAVSPDAQLLVGAQGGTIGAWDLISGKKLVPNDDAHQGRVLQVAGAGNLVVTAGADDTIRVWDSTSAKQRLKLTHDGHPVSAIALSPDGTKLVSLSANDAIYLWEVATGKPIYKQPGHGRLGIPGTVAFASNGEHFLSWGNDGWLRQWDVATGKVVLDRKIPQDTANSTQPRPTAILGACTFSPSGTRFVLSPVLAGNKIQVFDVASGQDLFQLSTNGGPPISQAISPDGRLLLTSLRSKNVMTPLSDGSTRVGSAKSHTIALWELSTRQLRLQIPLPEGGAGPVAFSSDSKLFAVAMGEPDRRIRLWNTANGQELAAIQGFRGTVVSLAFVSGSNHLISGMDDTTALVWDLAVKR